MPELPEIWNLAGQLSQTLCGATFAEAEILQPKCLNLPEADWRERALNRAVRSVQPHGKWVDFLLEGEYRLRVNLGMGGEVLLHERGEAPAERRRALFSLADGRALSVNFWWFGSLHAVGPGEAHPPFDKLGPDALRADVAAYRAAYAGKRSPIKTLLLRQDLLAGVGNYYVHDILFRARLHPAHPGNALADEDFVRLHGAVHGVFEDALRAGGADYERDLHNHLGRYSAMKVGYREGQPCPACGAKIVSARIGAANSYFCPSCQI